MRVAGLPVLLALAGFVSAGPICSCPSSGIDLSTTAGSNDVNLNDFQTQLLELKSQRAKLLDDQLKQQLDTIKQLNELPSTDATSNAMQLEMLKLQSLTQKSNEASNVMNDMMRKLQDSRASIIKNTQRSS
ncbi:hypothetical protein JCM8547_003075 [Rhodosporidiobolus lusitaniae]